LCSAAALDTLRAAPLPDDPRITAVANVTLRQTPAAGAPAVGQLPLGTEVVNVGPPGMDKTWIRVRAADGREGWLLSSLTRPIDPDWRWTTFDRIVVDRLARKGDGFPAAVELVSFIDRVAKEYTNPDGRAQIEFYRLRAISSALSAIPKGQGRREPYAAWLAVQSAVATYDEPGGRWILSDKAIWDLHGRSAKAPVADDIAWLAVTNGLSGECEGFLTCYVDWRNRLEGEYLRRHSEGRHAGEAVTTIKTVVDRLTEPAKAGPAFDFDARRDCQDLTRSQEALAKAVQMTRVPDRDAALASLAALKRVCQ
jgi:hypothetical protein